MVATLTRRFGDLGVAEDAAAEAFAAAVERWPRDGVPTTPGAWLTTTATRKALDRVRRESHRDAKHEEARLLFDDDERAPLGAVDDDRLRLVFTCCHPALSPDARVALTLRRLGGLTVPEIARAFLVQETTTGSQRAGARGVRAGDRAGGQHRGGGAPDPAARPAGRRRAAALTGGGDTIAASVAARARVEGRGARGVVGPGRPPRADLNRRRRTVSRSGSISESRAKSAND
ncbi:sigma factor [Cellulomonas sp. PSBB021]|uniref:sigma factor n=1 Tax=Cellulomonas sp. PSBB021 TaxID=2003551 RepID=UPI00351317EB